jgi:NAD(P) transhydrogenase beta subunit
MSASFAALLYLVAGALFIMALRGLSSPAASRQGNLYGMIGMAIAIVTTLAIAAPSSPLIWLLILAGIAIGGGIGAYTAKSIAMTAMSRRSIRWSASPRSSSPPPPSTRRKPSASPRTVKSTARAVSKWRSARPSVRRLSPAPSSPS